MSFLQHVASGVSKAASGADKQARIVRLKLQVNETETNIQTKLRELGLAALTASRAGKVADPDLDAIVESITALEAELKDRQEQLTALQGPPATEHVAPKADPAVEPAPKEGEK